MKTQGIALILLSLSWIGSACIPAPALAATTNTTGWFLKTTQALSDAVATGDKSVWDRTLADDCIITTEDGDVLNKAKFLAELKPLPPGFSGHIQVQDMTVWDLGSAAVAHYWLDEREDVFGQKLRTKYVETDTYRRAGDSWKMVAAQVTVVPRDFEPIKVDTHAWTELVGEYRFSEKSSNHYHVYMRKGALYGGRDEKSATLLIPLSPLVFFQKGSIHIMVFVRNTAGAITEVRELHKYNEVVMHRVQNDTR